MNETKGRLPRPFVLVRRRLGGEITRPGGELVPLLA